MQTTQEDLNGCIAVLVVQTLCPTSQENKNRLYCKEKFVRVL
jgi:hypothetical protein